MNYNRISLIIALFSFKVLSAQTNSCIDIRYIEATKYINNTDSVKSYIKKKLDKEALHYTVKDQLIKSNADAFWIDVKETGISRTDLRVMDSLSKDSVLIKGLASLSSNITSSYRMEFSEVIGNKIYAYLTAHQRLRELNNRTMMVSGGTYIVFLFLFDNESNLKQAFYHTLYKE